MLCKFLSYHLFKLYISRHLFGINHTFFSNNLCYIKQKRMKEFIDKKFNI